MTHDDFDNVIREWQQQWHAVGEMLERQDQHARALRMAKRLKLRIMEWSGSRERSYFVAEYVNGLEE